MAGGVLALAGGFLLWPSFERQSLPAAIAASLGSMARYADRVLAAPAADAAPAALLEAEHGRAGVDTTNLQATFQRVVAEPGESRERLEASLLAVVTLQRMLVSLNALRTFAPAPSPARRSGRDFRRSSIGASPICPGPSRRGARPWCSMRWARRARR